MTTADIIILITVIVLLGLIVYFSIIRPKIRKENCCTKCPYIKQCDKKAKTNKAECENCKEKETK